MTANCDGAYASRLLIDDAPPAHLIDKSHEVRPLTIVAIFSIRGAGPAVFPPKHLGPGARLYIFIRNGLPCQTGQVLFCTLCDEAVDRIP